MAVRIACSPLTTMTSYYIPRNFYDRSALAMMNPGNVDGGLGPPDKGRVLRDK